MRSDGPPDTVTQGEIIRKFAVEILAADGEWVETPDITNPVDSGRTHRHIGRILAEVKYRDGIMYGRMR